MDALGAMYMIHGFLESQGSKYPSRRYLPKIVITILHTEALNTLSLDPLEP